MKLTSSTICCHLDDILKSVQWFVHFRADRDIKHVVRKNVTAGFYIVLSACRNAAASGTRITGQSTIEDDECKISKIFCFYLLSLCVRCIFTIKD